MNYIGVLKQLFICRF